MQTSVYFAPGHLAYKRPYILPPDTLYTNAHIFYPRAPCIQTPVYFTPGHLVYKGRIFYPQTPCIQTPMYFTLGHLVYKRPYILPPDTLCTNVSGLSFSLHLVYFRPSISFTLCFHIINKVINACWTSNIAPNNFISNYRSLDLYLPTI